MTRDRTGESAEPHDCINGWLTRRDADAMRPCLICRPHLAKTTTSHDYAEREPSARAAAAIRAEESR
ncbi:hypothetical protein ACFVH4_18895 [Nocardia ignorata]|uniref:hypothetical protein n=1 Tax=Nocardia ignorata TaxID=145285 RepID=UPI00364496D8